MSRTSRTAIAADAIEVVNARTNNLRGVSIAIPKRQLVVFTGVSGSGKSSLVFDTIAAEAQRQLNQTYSAFIRNRLPQYQAPKADRLSGIPVSVQVDQSRLGGNARSIVGTATDIQPLLRLLFSRIGTPHVGDSTMFSFNNREGMCPTCEGLGTVDDISVDALIDRSKSLDEGPFRIPSWHRGSWRWKRYAYTGFFDNAKPLDRYTKAEWHRLIDEVEISVTHPLPGWHKSSTYEGVLPRFRRTYALKDPDRLKPAEREALALALVRETCPTCKGGRLKPEVLSSKIQGHNIAECSDMEICDLIAFIERIQREEVQPVIALLVDQLKVMAGLGLDYLSLGRETRSLSGGESQRAKMVRHLGSSLSDIAYIFDEPSTGLHPRDVHQVTELLERLRDKGNSVLVVEHDPDVIAVADYVIDVGPGAGKEGGEIVFQGTLTALLRSSTVTAEALKEKRSLRAAPRVPDDWLRLRGGSLHNVKSLDVDLPLGVMTAIVGVAGSGKSTLVNLLIRSFGDIVHIDQGQLNVSRRSTPATYLGVQDAIRARFAERTGLGAAMFSRNSEGACPVCRGLGVIRLDLAFMEASETTCEACGGTGFSPEALSVEVDGRTIADVAQLTAREAVEAFAEMESVRTPLGRMVDVGLGHMPIGQELSSLSGGERQRLRLADELGGEGMIFVLDEPSTGLHMRDVAQLAALLDRLVDGGKTLVVIEHNLELIAKSDWIIEMGPGAGKRGGVVTFTGTPLDMTGSNKSITGKFLIEYLSNQ